MFKKYYFELFKNGRHRFVNNKSKITLICRPATLSDLIPLFITYPEYNMDDAHLMRE